MSLLSSFVLIIPFCVIVNGYTKQIVGISDLTMFITSVLQLRVGLAAIIYSYGDMLGASYAIQPYRQLVDHPGAHPADYPSLPAHSPIRLRLNQLHFQYRDANTAALNKINLSIQVGETIAVVGENGSGKSTLIKLICGFYPPTAGSIQWNVSGRKPRIVGVFQDFARLPLNTLDNMVSEEGTRTKETLHLIGLDFLQSMLDKPLTVEIEGGIALSGGQWQRLAIARAMMHAEEADLLVFDEPTSSLDPEAEGKLMQVIMALTAHRSALIVSHRLALARFANRIIVMDAGRIIEEGAHETLMKQEGKYYQMFRSQADLYL
ncbi:Putative Abc transporter, atp-binding protein,hlyb family (fragment) [Candidatus Glomeribacter gigasporarum BEG34]|uniref:Putative Abc transporter, atp-binding protein,hlyb family n=2 Tax=Candidatus Glomeribacter gigasporarum TaxID=132144 RepID=G2JC21_9BURK